MGDSLPWRTATCKTNCHKRQRRRAETTRTRNSWKRHQEDQGTKNKSQLTPRHWSDGQPTAMTSTSPPQDKWYRREQHLASQDTDGQHIVNHNTKWVHKAKVVGDSNGSKDLVSCSIWKHDRVSQSKVNVDRDDNAAAQEADVSSRSFAFGTKWWRRCADQYSSWTTKSLRPKWLDHLNAVTKKIWMFHYTNGRYKDMSHFPWSIPPIYT